MKAEKQFVEVDGQTHVVRYEFGPVLDAIAKLRCTAQELVDEMPEWSGDRAERQAELDEFDRVLDAHLLAEDD